VLRYYLDEHVPGYIARQLRRHGVDVLTTQEAGRANQGIDDPDQLAYATNGGRVIVTKDEDYVPLSYQQLPHAGIIWLQKEDSIGKYIEFLETAAKVMEPEEIANRLIYYEW
jgi:predicted nuclease of predicted toxin-antitoxin system